MCRCFGGVAPRARAAVTGGKDRRAATGVHNFNLLTTFLLQPTSLPLSLTLIFSLSLFPACVLGETSLAKLSREIEDPSERVF